MPITRHSKIYFFERREHHETMHDLRQGVRAVAIESKILFCAVLRRRRAAAQDRPMTNKPTKTIAQIVREAQERGMSYGQYMLIVEGRA